MLDGMLGCTRTHALALNFFLAQVEIDKPYSVHVHELAPYIWQTLNVHVYLHA